MKKTVFLITMLCLMLTGVKGQQRIDEELTALRQWKATTVVSECSVKAYGMDKCFIAEKIPDNVWARMQGKTYKPNNDIGRQDLRYLRLLHWDLDNQIHIGEMVCNQKIASDLVEIFKQLFEARYPIERMVLPDEYNADDEQQMRANNTSCFCYRPVAGSGHLSNHALGMAVDLNTLYNPYVKRRTDGTLFIQPSTGEPYIHREANFPYKITKTDLAYRLFTEHGFTWGGEWKSLKDYQHFER